MSASLVGSEMCIRDRISSITLRRLRVRRVGGSQTLGGWAVGHWEHTVSYTHLTLPTICSV
eukprot:1050437-Alexandrium_andersonii.AAC.1